MKKIYLLLLLCFASLSLQAQENCPHYKRLMGEAEKFIQQGSLQQALDKYNSALTHCPQKQEEVKAKIDTLFVLIDGLRKEAEAKETEALKMQTKMQRAVFDKAVQDKFPEWQGYGINFEKKEEILHQIDSLDLSESALISLPRELLDCPNLQHLNLLGNDKMVWDSLAMINDLPKLQSIYVSVNDLSDIEEKYWGKITGIEILTNGLKKFPENILAQKQLRYLDLGGGFNDEKNQFNTLPESLFELRKLEYLELPYCQIQHLPSVLQNLKYLKRLNLFENQLSSLPSEIGELINLTELYLGGNQLTDLPTKIGKLNNLTELDLSLNKLTRLPPEIGNLQRLHTLNVYFNYLQNLPIAIGNLIHLQMLWLGGNYLSSLPKEMVKLIELRELNLHHNYLSTLPEGTSDLKKLQSLDLTSNPIKSKERKKIRQLIPDCKIEFSESFSYDRLFWSYYKQGILKEKIDDFKELEKLDLSHYRFSISKRAEIQKLLPDCEITFRELTTNDYNRAVIEEYNKGNYKIAYEYQQKACELDSTNAGSFFNLAYFALYNNDYQAAISAAQKTLELDPKQVSVETNLALGYLLNNQWKEAEKIYAKWKGKKFPDGRDCNAVFLQDIADLEKAGVEHQDFEKVRELLE